MIDAVQTPDILYGFLNNKLIGKNKDSGKVEKLADSKLVCIHKIFNSA